MTSQILYAILIHLTFLWRIYKKIWIPSGSCRLVSTGVLFCTCLLCVHVIHSHSVTICETYGESEGESNGWLWFVDKVQVRRHWRYVSVLLPPTCL